MSSFRTALVGIALIGSISVLSSPGSAMGTPEQRAACMGDVFTHCAAYIPNENKVAACLIAKRHQLSPGCQAQFK